MSPKCLSGQPPATPQKDNSSQMSRNKTRNCSKRALVFITSSKHKGGYIYIYICWTLKPLCTIPIPYTNEKWPLPKQEISASTHHFASKCSDDSSKLEKEYLFRHRAGHVFAMVSFTTVLFLLCSRSLGSRPTMRHVRWKTLLPTHTIQRWRA